MDCLCQVSVCVLVREIDILKLAPFPFFSSGYDFGYLIRLLTSCKLPDKEKDFFELLAIFFPKIYDVKYLMKSCKSLKGGLQEVADSLEVGLSRWLSCNLFIVSNFSEQLERQGTQHQAGSDSYLTGAAFFKMKQVCPVHLLT